MSKEKLIARIVNGVFRVLFLTLRIRIDDRSGFYKNPPPHPVIYTFWHNRILAITAAFLRTYPAGRKGVSVLVSPSRDGRLLAEVAKGFGMGAVFGSNNKRPAQAVREASEILRRGADLAITPDGPRGPVYKLNPGVVFLSQKEKIPIIPMHARFSNALRIKSWDEFRIPLPFSRIDITMSPYEWIPETEDDAAFEEERKRLEKIFQDEVD